MPTILLTGCASFIDSNFVLDWIALEQDPDVNLDKLTYVTDRPGYDRRYAIDTTKINRILRWKPAETFETGVRKTVQWYLDKPDWVRNVTSGAYKNCVECLSRGTTSARRTTLTTSTQQLNIAKRQ